MGRSRELSALTNYVSESGGEVTLENVANAYLSGGVYFGTAGVTSGSGTETSNYLDDYETGSWTPTLLVGGSSTGITGSSFVGIYTKVGNKVLVSCQIRLTNKGSGSGNLTISGLPFSKTNYRFYAPIGYYNWVNVPTKIKFESGTTVQVLDGHELEAANYNDINNNAEIYFSLSYLAT